MSTVLCINIHAKKDLNQHMHFTTNLTLCCCTWIQRCFSPPFIAEFFSCSNKEFSGEVRPNARTGQLTGSCSKEPCQQVPMCVGSSRNKRNMVSCSSVHTVHSPIVTEKMKSLQSAIGSSWYPGKSRVFVHLPYYTFSISSILITCWLAQQQRSSHMVRPLFPRFQDLVMP